MENENMRENENMEPINAPEEIADEVCETENEAAAETVEEAADDIIEEEAFGDVTEEPEAEEADLEADFEAAESDGEAVEEYDEEAAMAAEAEAKKQKRRKNVLVTVGAAVAVCAAVAVWSVCVMNGVGGKNIVSCKKAAAKANAETAAVSADIKFENPIYTGIESVVFGGKDKTVLRINDTAVDKGAFQYFVNVQGINLVGGLMQNGTIGNVSKFAWTDIDKENGLTYQESAKMKAVDGLVPIYAMIDAGEKNGIKLTEDDKKKFDESLAQIKESYGADYEKELKNAGYPDEKTLLAVWEIQSMMQKVAEDFDNDMNKYASSEVLEKYLTDDKVKVKHILIRFTDTTDEAKTETKKKAEEVLKKVKDGGDFDKLVEEYNEDPGQTEDGYTFANDGSMMQEFADASFALEIGKTSELVETDYGYHIIKRLKREPSIEEYVNYLIDTADVSIKKNVYDSMVADVNLNYYFGEPESAATGGADAK